MTLSSDNGQGDVHTLIEAVKTAKRCKLEYEAAQDALGEATDKIRDLIGGGWLGGDLKRRAPHR
jgi:hypothetical protein